MSMVSVYQYIVTLNDNIVDKVSPAVAEGTPTLAGSTPTVARGTPTVAGATPTVVDEGRSIPIVHC